MAGLKEVVQALKGAAPETAAASAPFKLSAEYYDKVPLDQRMSRRGVSHPGVRWEVYDPKTGKVESTDLTTKAGANRSQDRLDNAYGGYKYQVRPIRATEMTEAEQKFLKDNNITLGAGSAPTAALGLAAQAGAVPEAAPQAMPPVQGADVPENQTIIDLLKRANSQLQAQNNEPGGADRPTPGGPASVMEPAVKGTLGAVGDVVGGIMGLPKQFMEASARDVTNLGDHTQQKESVGPAAEIAMNLAGGGMPMAERSAAGIFGGKLARTADHGQLAKAEQMVADGMLPDDIRYATGWFRSPADQKWRFEIPDNRSVMKYMPEVEGNKAFGSVDSLLSHRDLFDAYPQLRSQGLTLTKDSSSPRGSGLYDMNAEKAFVNAPDWRAARDVSLHELQHAVQKIEGFSPGANPSYYAQQIEKGLKKNPDWAGVYDFNEVKQQARNLYNKTAGEVEARNVQARKDMSTAGRKNIHPWATQDIPYLDQYAFDPVAETIRALRQQR